MEVNVTWERQTAYAPLYMWHQGSFKGIEHKQIQRQTILRMRKSPRGKGKEAAATFPVLSWEKLLKRKAPRNDAKFGPSFI